jgi:hypothetical protein
MPDGGGDSGDGGDSGAEDQGPEKDKPAERQSRRLGLAARLRQLVAEQLRGEPVDPREPDKKKDDEPPQ